MPVRFTRLRAPALAHVGARASPAERHQLVHVVSHAIGDTDDALKIVAYAREFAGFLQHLHVAASVGKRSTLLVGIRDGQHHVSDASRFGENMSCTTTNAFDRAKGSTL